MVTEVLDGDGNKSGKKKAKPASFKSKYQKNWDVLVMYVDLYKHHFDLSVKAYVIYLAIIGTDASFVFRQDIDSRTRTPLLYLALIASTLATAAWTTALIWAKSFGDKVNVLCDELKIDAMPMFGTRIVLFLKVVGALVLMFGSIILLRQ